MKCPSPRSLLNKRRGFSLVELLAAMAVFALLGTIIVQITNTATQTTRLSDRAVDAAAQARLAFDRISLDLGAIVQREDTAFLADNPSVPSNEIMMFLSSVASSGPAALSNRNMSVIGYRVDAHDDNAARRCLLRAGNPINWNEATFMGEGANGMPTGFTGLAPAAEDYDILAPGVIQMVVGFQLCPDNEPVTLLNGSVVANARGQIVYSPPVRSSSAPGNTIIDVARISSLVVGLVCLDLNSVGLLSASQVDSLASRFSVPSAIDDLPVAHWASAIETLTSSPGTVPLHVCQSLRTYQRFYPMTPYGIQANL